MWRVWGGVVLALVCSCAMRIAAATTVTLEPPVGAVRSTVVSAQPVAHQRVIIEPVPGHVLVTDTFTNPTSVAIGLIITHSLPAPSAPVFRGGRPEADPAARYAPWNPTLFVPNDTGGGVGLVAEDDVFRNQLQLVRDDGRAALHTDMLCLAPGARYAMTWSVYTQPSGDYWDFIARVRSDWRVNDTTIPGALVWFRPDEILARSPEQLARALAAQNVAVASLNGGWVDPQGTEAPPRIGFGTHVLDPPFAAYRERIRAAVRSLHAARPGITVLLYFDAQRESAPDAETRFGDSLFRFESGRPERSDFGGRFTPSWSMVPTIGNAFGRALPAVVAAMKDLGADGLYWDEMDAVEYSAPRVTAGQWDGFTCRLDRNGVVRAKLGLANLLGDPLKARLAQDTVLLGNSPPTTRRFQDRHDLRMVEAQHNDTWGAFAHLTTPLGYLGSWVDWPRLRAKVEEGVLVAGGSLDRPVPFIARMFPFTVESLRPGVLRGRERIVVTRSGSYGWPGATRDVRQFRYDGTGAEHPGAWPVERRGDGDGVSVQIGLAPGEAAIVERVQ